MLLVSTLLVLAAGIQSLDAVVTTADPRELSAILGDTLATPTELSAIPDDILATPTGASNLFSEQVTIALTGFSAVTVKPGLCPSAHGGNTRGPGRHRGPPRRGRPNHDSSVESGSDSKESKGRGHQNPCLAAPCRGDADCKGSLKCCAIERCGQKCVKPLIRKPSWQHKKTP